VPERVAIDGVVRGYVNRADIQKLANILHLNFVDDLCQPLLRRTLMAIGVPSESAMIVSNSLNDEHLQGSSDVIGMLTSPGGISFSDMSLAMDALGLTPMLLPHIARPPLRRTLLTSGVPEESVIAIVQRLDSTSWRSCANQQVSLRS